jgi:predicted nucleic acid-binding protein
MVYLDTNIFIYASVEQDIEKKSISLELIQKLAKNSELKLSTLTIQEMAFTLAKLGADLNMIKTDVEYYMNYLRWQINIDTLKDAVKLGLKANKLKSINDIIHLKVAEQHCNKLITFDSDFRSLRSFSNIEIEIIS